MHEALSAFWTEVNLSARLILKQSLIYSLHRDWVSCSPGCPQTHHVNEDERELLIFPSIGIVVCVTLCHQDHIFFSLFLFSVAELFYFSKLGGHFY